MYRLDYFSCALTILSTCLVGRRMWQGWVIAGVNSVIICVIGFRTAQLGLIPANVFCLAMYGYNIFKWRNPVKPIQSPGIPSVVPEQPSRMSTPEHANLRTRFIHERTHRQRSRIRPRSVPVAW